MLRKLLTMLFAVTLMAGTAVGANFTNVDNNNTPRNTSSDIGGEVTDTVTVSSPGTITAVDNQTGVIYTVLDDTTLRIANTLTISSTTGGNNSTATLASQAVTDGQVAGVIRVSRGGTLVFSEEYDTGGTPTSQVTNAGYTIFEAGSAIDLDDFLGNGGITNTGKVAIDGHMTDTGAGDAFSILAGAGDVQLMGGDFNNTLTNDFITGIVYTGDVEEFGAAFSAAQAEVVIGGYSLVDPAADPQVIDQTFMDEAGITSTEAPIVVDFLGNFTADSASIAEDVRNVNFATGFAVNSNPFVIGQGQTVTYGSGNSIDGAVESQIDAVIVVEDNGSFATAGGGAELLSGSSVTVNEGGHIDIGVLYNKDPEPQPTGDAATLTLADGSTLDLDSNAYIMAAVGVANGQTLVSGATGDTTEYNIDGGATDATELQNWLDNNAYYGIEQTGLFGYDSGDIIFAGDDVAPEDQLKNFKDTVLPFYDAGDAAGLATQDTIDAFNAISDMTAEEIQALNDPNLEALQHATTALADGDYKRRDLRDMGPEAYLLMQHNTGADWANTVEAVQDTVRSFNNAISHRVPRAGKPGGCVVDECGNLVPTCGSHYGNRIWAGYTGYFADADARGTDRGYKYNAHGFNVGYDHTFNSGLGFGAAFGLAKGDYKNKIELSGHKNDIDNYSFGLYANYASSAGFFATVLGTYTYSEYKMYGLYGDYYDRGKYHSGTWSFGGRLGWDIAATSRFTITPSIGVFHYDTDTNTFDTKTRDGMKYSKSFTEMPVELELRYNIPVDCENGNLALVANGGYAYNFRDRGVKIHNFKMLDQNMGARHARKAGRSSWYAGAGIAFQFKRFDIGVNYEFYKRSDYDAHNVNANIGLSF